MPAAIRLKRVGRKKQPSYRIVVIEKSDSVGGPPIEKLGIYQPRTEPAVIRLDAEKALRWLRDGAEPSDTVRSLFQRTGLWEKFHDGITPEELTEKEIYLGPEGAWKTSGRAAAAAEAREQARAEREAAEAAEAEVEAAESAAATATVTEGEEATAEAEEVAEAEEEEEAEAEEEAETVEEAEADEDAAAKEPVAEAEVEEPEAEAEEEGEEGEDEEEA